MTTSTSMAETWEQVSPVVRPDFATERPRVGDSPRPLVELVPGGAGARVPSGWRGPSSRMLPRVSTEGWRGRWRHRRWFEPGRAGDSR